MCKNLKDCIHTPVTLNPREAILGFVACVMTGVVIGMLISPRKNVTIGSHNGSNNHALPHPPESAEENTEDAAKAPLSGEPDRTASEGVTPCVLS